MMPDHLIPAELAACDTPWRSFGKDGKGPAVISRLADLTTEHLRNILRTQKHIRGKPIERAIRTMLEAHPKGKV